MNKNARLQLAAAVGVLMIVAQAARADERFAGLDEYARAAMRRWDVPGMALAVVKDGEIVIARGYGVCSLGDSRAVSADTVFPIASCAKAFTAACIGLLVDEGKLAWDDPVARHLPGFELGDPYLTKHVTLRDLLCHRVGLQRGDLLGDRGDFDPAEILRRVKHLRPVAEFRTRFSYSNQMYITAGEVVAHVGGSPFERFLDERVFYPLGMNATRLSALDVVPERLALRHWRSDAGIAPRPVSHDNKGEARGVHSTVLDMARWLKLQLAEGEYDGRRLLAASTVREMHAMHFSIPIAARPAGNIYAARFYGTGLGWMVVDYRGRKLMRHGGAWGSAMALVPEERLGVVVLTNLDLDGIADLLTYDLLDAYLVGPDVAWQQGKWKTWLEIEGPGSAYRARDRAKARLDETRPQRGTLAPPLDHYAGTYVSQLYGPIQVRLDAGRLRLTCGKITTDLAHFHDESFYARSPTRLNYDWLVTFGKAADGRTGALSVKHVGWDTGQEDHTFVREKG